MTDPTPSPDTFTIYVLYDNATGNITGTRAGSMLHVETIAKPYITIPALPTGDLYADYIVSNGALAAKPA